MQEKSIYIESSIFGPLTSRPNPAPHLAAIQQATIEWWNYHRHGFKLHVSDLVLEEIAQGEPFYAQRRLQLARELNRLPISTEVQSVAKELIERHAIPVDSKEDAVHIACAAVHHLDYLLTWNCKHIANPLIQTAIRQSLLVLGVSSPKLLTPAQLLVEK